MKRMGFMAGLLVTTVLILSLMLPAAAQVEPPTVEIGLPPGGEYSVQKCVTTPVLPPVVDVVISVDLTASMGGELDNLNLEIDDIITALSAESADLMVGIVSHEDYPAYYDHCGYAADYGDPAAGDEAFRVDYAVGDDFAAASAAVAAMTLKWGSDDPESYARVMWEAGQDDSGIGFRGDAQKILVMFLDNVPHDCDLLGDGTVTTGVDPGRDEIAANADDIDLQDDAIVALQNEGIILLVVSSGVDTDLWDVWAAATGGSAVQINDDGTVPGGISLTELILNQISELTTDVWWEVVADPGLTVDLDPDVALSVPGDTTICFDEVISVDPDATQCETLEAVVTFYANTYPEEGEVIGRQLILVDVLDVTSPEVACLESVNPHGNKIPPAGSTTLPGPKGGQNEDGFYMLQATDNCDDNPVIYVVDTGSGVVFGPFSSGDVIKYTEDPDAMMPEMKKMGSDKGRAGAIAAHIIGNGDAAVYAVDASGNLAYEICYVPPAPK